MVDEYAFLLILFLFSSIRPPYGWPVCFKWPTFSSCIEAKSMKFPATSSPNWQKKANDRSLTKRPAPRAIWMARSPCCQQLSERFLSQMPRNNPFHLGDTSSRTRYFFPSRENQTFTISREDSHSECSGGLSNGHDDHHSVDKPTPLFTFPFPISRLSQFTERPNGLCRCDVHLKGHTSWPGHARRLTRFSHEDAAADESLLGEKTTPEGHCPW